MYNIKIKYIGGIKVDMKIYNNKNEIDTSNFRAWAEIDLSKLKHNVEVIRKLLHDDVDIIGVVKANAYGHGDIVVSKYLESIGVKHFAVAFIEEAIKLRKSGIKGEIIILGWTPCCRKDELIKYDLCQTLVSEEYAEELKKSVYLFGAKPQVIEAMKRIMQEKYPHAKLAGACDGYVKNKDEIFEHISQLQPDIVLVALGIPAQEKLIYRHLDSFSKGILVGVGGSFDVMSGTKKRAPQFFIKLNLEWLYRILKEPSRLKRFYQNNWGFMLEVKNLKKRGKGHV